MIDLGTLAGLLEHRQRIAHHGANGVQEAVIDRARFHVEVDAPSRSFTVETGKGAVRTWTSIDSAAKWLRNLGIGHVALELAHWAPGQKSLLA